MIGSMVHATSAIRPQGVGEFAAWVKEQGWDVGYFKTMNEFNAKLNRPPRRGAFLERKRDSNYFRRFAAVAGPLGITAIPYVFVMPWDAKAQGRNFGRQVVGFGSRWACANVERTFETVSKALRVKGSEDWLDGFREIAGDGVKLILSTFAERDKHPAFPWDVWMPRVEVFSGQAYSQRSAGQVRRMVEMAREFGMGPDRVWPCLRGYEGDHYYGKSEILKTTAEAIAMARELGCESWMFWQQKTLQAWPEMVEVCKGKGQTTGLRDDEIGAGVQRWLNSVREDGDELLDVDNDVATKTVGRLREHLARLPDPLAVARAANLEFLVEGLEVSGKAITAAAEDLEHTFSV